MPAAAGWSNHARSPRPTRSRRWRCRTGPPMPPPARTAPWTTRTPGARRPTSAHAAGGPTAGAAPRRRPPRHRRRPPPTAGQDGHRRGRRGQPPGARQQPHDGRRQPDQPDHRVPAQRAARRGARRRPRRRRLQPGQQLPEHGVRAAARRACSRACSSRCSSTPRRTTPTTASSYTQRLLSLATVALGAVHPARRRCAPPMIAAGFVDAGPQRSLTSLFATLLLPEIFFYGLGAMFMAVLNIRHSYGPGRLGTGTEQRRHDRDHRASSSSCPARRP